MTEEQKQALCAKLREETEAAQFLADDRVYTKESYFSLVTAIGCAKAVLAGEVSGAITPEEALADLRHAVDAMELCQTKKKNKKACREKTGSDAVSGCRRVLRRIAFGKQMFEKAYEREKVNGYEKLQTRCTVVFGPR